MGWVPGAPYSCSGVGCARVEDINGTAKLTPVNSFGKTLQAGEDYLGGAFARVKQAYNFDYTLNPNATPITYKGYIPNSSVVSALNTTDKGKPVNLYPAINCNNQNQCFEDQKNPNRLTVNGIVSKDITITKGTPQISLQFFAHADDDQMPIRKITVDWVGDGSKIFKYDGLYRNHRGLVQSTCDQGSGNCEYDLAAGGQVGSIPNNGTSCKTNLDCPAVQVCNYGQKFGYLPNQTCDSDYFEYDYVYQCDKNSATFTNDPAKGGYDAKLFPNGACVFKPRVLIEDNWGWCNGTKNCDAKNNEPGCYNGTQQKMFNYCDFIYPDAGAAFANKIFVAPTGF